MLRKLFIFLLVLFVIHQYSVVNAFAEERIRSFDSDIKIQSDGSIRVIETILYDFGFSYRHGIYRDIPSIVYRERNDKYILKYSVESVTDEAGGAYQYSLLYPSDYLRIKIGDANRTISGEHTYIITYVVQGALTYLPDHTELYWNGTGDQWEVPIDSAHITVELPKQIFGSELKLACYTGTLGSAETDCSSSSKGTIQDFTVMKSLGAKEGATVVVGFPKGTVATLQAERYVSFFDRWYGQLLLIGLFLLALLWYVMYPIWIVVKWFRRGRDPRPMMGETRAWFDPPTTSRGRKLTPAETGALLDESVDNKDISAMIVDLARRGYLQIEERDKKDFYLLKKSKVKKDDSLLPFERTFLDSAFADGGELRLKNSALYTTILTIKTQIYTQIVSDQFFPKDPSKTRLFYGAIAVLGFITFNLPLAIVAILFGLHMAKKTQQGADAAAVGRSLKNFLSSQERQLAYQASKQMMFERLLPFAVAFGVEKLWAERFKDVGLKQPEWYTSSHIGAFHSAAFVSSLDSSLKSVSIAAQPPHSSGSGFSGGFSGGGGGGGGGGSW